MNYSPTRIKISKKAKAQSILPWLFIIFSGVLVLAVMFFMKPADAQTALKSGQQLAQYDVYAGGIHALQSNLSVDTSAKDNYAVELSAKTYGLLGKMAPWQGVFNTKGWHDKSYKPELHQSTTTWQEEKEIKKYSYGKNGDFKSYSIKDNENDGTPKKVDDELTKNTSDVLSATLNVMQEIAKTGNCASQTDIFDGRRRYTLIFQENKKVELEASRWNVYSGPAVECTAEVKPVAGKWHEKPRGWLSIQEQGRERGTMPTVWFAKVKEGEPAIPVKVRVKTSYGTLFMHMTKYQTNDMSLVLK